MGQSLVKVENDRLLHKVGQLGIYYDFLRKPTRMPDSSEIAELEIHRPAGMSRKFYNNKRPHQSQDELIPEVEYGVIVQKKIKNPWR